MAEFSHLMTRNLTLRTELHPGDLSFIVYKHAKIFWTEQAYGIQNEKYVLSAMLDFFEGYTLKRNKIWICEKNGNFVGSIALVHRTEETAQLRFFILEQEYRGCGIGKELLSLPLKELRLLGYKNCYLWTTDELKTATYLYTKAGFSLVEEKKSVTLGKSLIEQKYELIIY